MDQQQIDDMGSSKRAGRKSGDGTPETIKWKPLKDATSELMKAYKKLEHQRESYNSMCSDVAEKSGVNASTLKRLVRSSAKGNFKEVQRDIDQAAIVFETVGEIAGGAISSGE